MLPHVTVHVTVHVTMHVTMNIVHVLITFQHVTTCYCYFL